jgi:hypothetical protein
MKLLACTAPMLPHLGSLLLRMPEECFELDSMLMYTSAVRKVNLVKQQKYTSLLASAQRRVTQETQLASIDKMSLFF